MYLPPEIQTGQKVAFWRSTKEGLYVLYLSEQAKGQVQLGQKAQEDSTGASWWEGYGGFVVIWKENLREQTIIEQQLRAR